MNLILDMDGTLIDGFYGERGEVVVQPRPYLREFIAFVFDRFENVSIWTHGDDRWFTTVYTECLQHMLPKHKQFYFVKTRGYAGVGVGAKWLDRIYADHPDHHEYNTFIVDDTPATYWQNIANSVPIKTYDSMATSEGLDTELVRVARLFDIPLFPSQSRVGR